MTCAVIAALVVILGTSLHAQQLPSSATAGGNAAPKPVGHAIISADPTQCANATSLQIWSWGTQWPTDGREAEGTVIRTGLSPSGGQMDLVLTRIIDEPPGNCRWTFTTLPLGDYVAVLKTPHGSGGSTAFVIRDADAADVTIPPPLVKLSGRLVINDVPVVGATVRAAQLPFMIPTPTTVTDADGRYTVFLAHPGEVHVTVLKGDPGRAPSALLGTVLTLVTGENTKDFAIHRP